MKNYGNAWLLHGFLWSIDNLPLSSFNRKKSFWGRKGRGSLGILRGNFWSLCDSQPDVDAIQGEGDPPGGWATPRMASNPMMDAVKTLRAKVHVFA